jgi:hypothetical protein
MLNCLPELTAAGSLLGLLGEELEGSLLGLVTSLYEASVSLLASGGLLAANDLAALVLYKVLTGKTTAGVVGSAVEYLGFAADCEHATCHVGLSDFGVHCVLSK